MPRIINPRTLAPPTASYAHGLVHSARARRLITSGLVGLRADGTLPEDVQGQLEQAFDNLEVLLREAGMGITELVRLKLFSASPGAANAFAQLREKRLGKHRVTVSYLEVAALAAPEYLLELEAEAISEEGEMAFLDFEGDMSESAGSGRASQMAKPERPQP